MSLGHHLLTLTAATALLVAPASPVRAADALPTGTTLTANAAYADSTTLLQVDVTEPDGTPVVDATVDLERRRDGAWTDLGSVVTDDAGHAELPAVMDRDPKADVFRASYAGDEVHAGSGSGPVQVELLRRTSRATVDGPASVVDEQPLTLQLGWHLGNGDPVSGPVEVWRRVGGGAWTRVATVRTGSDGTATYTSRPRTDTDWQARVRALAWVTGDRSAVHAVDNRPPGEPVQLPTAAPHPRIPLPPQPHAVGVGPHVVVTRIPDRVWRQMTGATWHSGCPVGRASLRYARINYWDYAGYRRRGELVANQDAVGRITAALAEMYQAHLPIRSMYREDRFGWSSRVHGADDYKSMAAGNTSVFNCRGVVGNPAVRSPHAYGRALDLNTWENPYRSRQGTVPNTWWQSHAHPRVAWRARSHQVVQIMARHGLRWTYGLEDTQHFDAPVGSGRYLPRPLGCRGACD